MATSVDVFVSPYRASTNPENMAEIDAVLYEITCLESRPLKRNKEISASKTCSPPADMPYGLNEVS